MKRIWAGSEEGLLLRLAGIRPEADGTPKHPSHNRCL